MRIRLHKSRTTTFLMVASIVLGGTAASGAAISIIKSMAKDSNLKQSKVVDNGSASDNTGKPADGNGVGNGSSGPGVSPGKSCAGRDQVMNNEIPTRNLPENSNGDVADCTPVVGDDNSKGGGGGFSNNIQNIEIIAQDQNIPYNGKEHDVVYTVRPSDASCYVKYNGLAAKPVEKGMYDARIYCSYNSANAEKSVILTVTDEVTKEVTKTGPAKKPSVKKFKPIKIPFTLSSSNINSNSIAKIVKLASTAEIKSVTVYGYAQPSGNKVADLKLSRQRAEAVAKQISNFAPSLKIKIKALGSKITAQCAPVKNKCVIVK